MRWAPAGCLPLFVLGALFLLPLFFADFMLAALAQLGLGPAAAFWAALGIFLGGLFNIPVKKVVRHHTVRSSSFPLFGLHRVLGQMAERRYTVVAVNVGGCLVPCCLVIYELVRIAGHGLWPLIAAGVAAGVNVAVCHRLARPMEGVGIALSPLVPALTAVLCALVLLPGHAPAVAFSAGVLGPLVGADLLHLKDIDRINTGMASIGGAGTFDGIVLSGLLATLLAS